MNKDGIQLIIQEHREVDQMAERVLNAGIGMKDEKRRFFNQIVHDLSQHAVIEEMILYPLLRERVVGEGGPLAEHSLEEHQEVKNKLNELDNMDIEDPAFNMKFRSLMESLHHHVFEEENKILPALKAKMSPQELSDFYDSWMARKALAPTHPHPAAPNKPPMNTLGGPALKAVDAVRDMGRDFPEKV
eukprot:GILJ01010148.1.p1 GENE.GILJ01010148.1~~GILJ01010148.1.p1  ORF type:complete len:188 (-),score=37.50 GILJ01010148.1:140-703(-)